MKRKAAVLMATIMAVSSVFADGTAAFALEEAEAATETAEIAALEKTGTSKGAENVAEESPEAEEEEIMFEDSEPTQPAETSADVEETDATRIPETETPADAEAGQTIELDLDENAWIEIAPSVADAGTSEGVPLDSAHFPDANFLQYLRSTHDKDEDNTLSSREIAQVTRIELWGKGIESLKGIEYFTGLKELACGKNSLTELDVSKNTALTELSCDDNQLKALDVDSNTELNWLKCGTNQLTELDVSKNTELRNLFCDNNQLTALNVRRNTKLEKLNCDSNQLTELDVSKNTALTELTCGVNQLTKLDVSKNTALTELVCDSNKLTELNININTALTHLSCSINPLKALDVSRNKNLDWLYCSNSQLTNLDLSENTALATLICIGNQLTNLDVSKNTALTTLSCDGNQLANLDVSKNEALKNLSCIGNQLTVLDVSHNAKLESLKCDLQRRTVRLPYTDGGWQLDMAALVGSENLSKLGFVSNVPAMKEGVITFSQDELPENPLTYTYDTGWNGSATGNNILMHVGLMLEKEAKPGETSPTQPGTSPGQSGGNTNQQGSKPGQSVSAAVQVKLNVSSIKLKTKQSTTKVKISGLAPGDAVVSWKSSNPKIVTVNEKTGKITAKAKKGTATITVTLKSGISKKFKVTVQKNAVACTKISLNKKSVTLKKGKKFTLKPTVTPITCVQKVTYKSSKNSVATVSKKGVIKAKKKGKATITVTVGKKKVKCKVKVK